MNETGEAKLKDRVGKDQTKERKDVVKPTTRSCSGPRSAPRTRVMMSVYFVLGWRGQPLQTPPCRGLQISAKRIFSLREGKTRKQRQLSRPRRRVSRSNYMRNISLEETNEPKRTGEKRIQLPKTPSAKNIFLSNSAKFS